MLKKGMMVFIILALALFSLLSAATDEKAVLSKYKLKAVENTANGTVSYLPSNAGGRSPLFLYIVKVSADGSYHVRIRLARFAGELLHVRKFTFTADEQDYALEVREPAQSMDLNRQNTPGDTFDREGAGICEFYDVGLNPEELETVTRIAAAKKVKLRIDGVKGFELQKVFSSELKEMNRVLEAFKAFKGE